MLPSGPWCETEQRLSLIQVSENLTVLPAGRPDPDPMSGLTSDRMRRIIQEADIVARNNAKVVPLLGHTVTVTGDVHEKNGMMMIAADDARIIGK